MKILIICGGNAPSEKLLKYEISKNEIIICVDGGANFLYKYKILPHFLIGDFDSINEDAFNFFKKSTVKIEKFSTKKDLTDSFLALEKAIELGATKISLLGCTGSRTDHFLNNIGLLLRSLNLNIKATIKDDNNFIMLSNKPIDILNKGKKYFSLIAYTEIVKNLSIEGSEYDIKNYDLLLGSSLCISNKFRNDKVKLKFDKGILIIILSKD